MNWQPHEIKSELLDYMDEEEKAIYLSLVETTNQLHQQAKQAETKLENGGMTIQQIAEQQGCSQEWARQKVKSAQRKFAKEFIRQSNTQTS